MDHSLTRFPFAVYAQRLDNAQNLLERHTLSGLIITPGHDFLYLLGSDFESHERFSALVISPRGPLLVLPAVDAESLSVDVAEPLGIDVVRWEDGENPYLLVAQFLADDSGVLDKPAAVSETMTAQHVLALQDTHLNLLNATTILSELFMRKDPSEIAMLRDAGSAIDRVHTQVPELLSDGRTEREVARDIERLILQEHTAVDFIIVGSGPNGAAPHHSFSDRVMYQGDMVVVDIGGTYGAGYHSDCTRNYVLGQCTDEQTAAYEVLQSAQEAGCEAARPGVTASQIDTVVRGVIEQAGMGEYFIHRTGHGIGLSTHEEPFIMQGNELILEEGMAFSIEPGIYFPDQWGARIEDIVVITDSGAERLNTTDRGLRHV